MITANKLTGVLLEATRSTQIVDDNSKLVVRHPALELRGLLAISILQGAHAAQAAPIPPLPPGCVQRPVLHAEGGRQHGLQESRPGGVLAHESGVAASRAGKYFLRQARRCGRASLRPVRCVRRRAGGGVAAEWGRVKPVLVFT